MKATPRTLMQQLTLVLTFGLLTLKLTEAADSKRAIKKAAAQKVCDLAQELKEVTPYVAQTINKLAHRAVRLAYLQASLEQINARKSGGGLKALTDLALAAYTAKNAITSVLCSKAKVGAEESGVCALHAGRLEDFIFVFYQVNQEDSSKYRLKGGKTLPHTDLTCLSSKTALKPIQDAS
ncbi:Trypanosome variant surface glycoprotein (A-type), putative [Trypanosoma equiperdum]|uniref:Trypanosome variant surface glycoprotein (A-type), putative n=1 Tax=Trypanosoma equiperdum TaxID=5694 RepID=A0A1G4I5V8_TRYEQ|nr:Trypanosome variant surface glycoprotein (A-type), putative [Trypanosoma equiperdum]